MFAIQKKKNGDLVLELGFNPFSNLLNLFTKIDYIFSQKIFYLLPMGLGIGFGLGIVIFSQPQLSNAGINANQSAIIPKELKISSQQKNYFIENQEKFTLVPTAWSNEVIFFPNWTSNQKQTVIAGKDFNLSSLTLGAEIKVTASNQGQYTFSVYHFKEIKSQNINDLKTDSEAKLILIKPTNFLGTSAQVILAK